MSLINDALKQAKQSQTKTPPTGAGPLPPVEPPPRNSGGSSMWILVVAAILFLAAAILFFKLLGLKHEPVVAATNAPVPAVAQMESPKAAPVKTNSVATAVTNAPTVDQSPKIQGLFYDPAKPWAIVDRKTVYIGSTVGNYKVLKISKNSVTLQRADGSTQELKLGE